ncbi:MAG TPA: hypothetical protein VNP96_10940 [Solirubrobacterales bacterium]|nr:hypothetical protein [Solirubrobacterales bacterium]
MAVTAFVAVLLVAPSARPAAGDGADLTVSKSDSPDPVMVDSVLTYAIGVMNLGPEDATEVTVSDRLPSHSRFVSAIATNGSCEHDDVQVICEVGGLSGDPTKGHTVTVIVQVRPTEEGTVESTVSVDSAESDPVKLNDTASAATEAIPMIPWGCHGVPATLTGTRGSERLVGTAEPDVIAARGGSDLINGLGGSDLVCAGRGNDRIGAGSGSDRVFGNHGNDEVQGRRGDDFLVGNASGDVLAGGRGDDRVRGRRGFDDCTGGPGFDHVRSCER